jgi:hypothetical protein
VCQLKVCKPKKHEDKHDEYGLQDKERYALLVKHKSSKRCLVQVKWELALFGVELWLQLFIIVDTPFKLSITVRSLCSNHIASSPHYCCNYNDSPKVETICIVCCVLIWYDGLHTVYPAF